MPMDPATHQALRGLVQRHHVHFDVREELEADGDARRRIGHRVRLWAVVSGKRILPGDAAASLFAAALREVAQKILPEDAGTTVISIEGTEPALYDSRVVPGADEIALDIVLHGGESVAAADEERCLRSVRKALESVGAPQRD